MANVVFTDQIRYNLAALIVTDVGASANATNRTIDGDANLLGLLAQFAGGQPTVLPLRMASEDRWLVVGDTRRDLDLALTGISRFILPTYAEHEGGAFNLQIFDGSGDPLNQLSAQIYTAGYYQIRSPRSHFLQILERLGMWVDLEARKPRSRRSTLPGYRALLDAFNAALSAGSWVEATGLLDELRRRNLTSADNLVFLEVQLLSQQRRWADLWQRADYGDIARLRAPHSVRDALVTAFHQSELLPLEQVGRWSDALDTFRRLRGRLGGLLEGPADTAYGPVLRAFAYRELSFGDRAAVDALAARAPDDETRLVIDSLAALLPAIAQPISLPETVIAPSTPIQRLRLALADGDYQTAWETAETIQDDINRTQAMLEIAFLSDSLPHAEGAMLQFWSLPDDTQEMLQRDGRRISRIIVSLSEAIAPPTPDVAEIAPLTDWLEWLAVAIADPDDPRLPRTLDVVASVDQRYWTTERVIDLADRLVELTMNTALSRSYLREAIRYLRDVFLQDPEFPREGSAYSDVYEALYLATLEQSEVNEVTTLALLRLAETRLQRSPAARDTVASHLTSWLAEPIPAIEAVAQEALDLLAAYGVQGPSLGVWYRGWAEALLSTPRFKDRLSLEGWLELGEWVQPGTDLLNRLRSRLSATETGEDIIAALPHGFQIAIFTLRRQSAERVSEMLRRRNPGLRIELCNDTVLTDRAKNLAQSTEMTVVVTTCITHALTYGIGPYLKDPTYPQSSGSTSIIRAIEGRLKAL